MSWRKSTDYRGQKESEGMKEQKFTYHWIIVAAVFVMFAATVAIVVNCFSVFGPAIMKDLSFSATEIQLVNLVCTFANLIGGVFIGRIMMKFGIRLTLPVYAAIMCIGLFTRGLCNSMLTFCISALVMGLGLSGCSTIPGSMLINNWFTDKKGTATGIAFSGSVVGGLIFVQISKALVTAIGWRTANTYLSIIAAVLLIPTAIFVVREKPSDKGMLPLGAEKSERNAEKPVLTGISTKAYLKTGSFWLLAFTSFGIGFCNLGMQNNVTICLESELGHSASFAANIFTIVMAVQIFGKIVLGAVYDKKGIKFGTVYNMLLFLLSVAALIFARNIAMAVAFGTLFGMMCSMTTVTPPYLTALIVGRRNYSSIYGLLSLFFGLGCAFGPVLAGKIFDATKSYTPAWIVFAVISILLALTSILSAKKAKGFAEMMD